MCDLGLVDPALKASGLGVDSVGGKGETVLIVCERGLVSDPGDGGLGGARWIGLVLTDCRVVLDLELGTGTFERRRMKLCPMEGLEGFASATEGVR